MNRPSLKEKRQVTLFSVLNVFVRVCVCLIGSICGDPQMLCVSLYVFQYINHVIDVLGSYCALESTYCAHKDTHVHSDIQLICDADSVDACITAECCRYRMSRYFPPNLIFIAK